MPAALPGWSCSRRGSAVPGTNNHEVGSHKTTGAKEAYLQEKPCSPIRAHGALKLEALATTVVASIDRNEPARASSGGMLEARTEHMFVVQVEHLGSGLGFREV